MEKIGKWFRGCARMCAGAVRRAVPVARALWDRFGYSASLVVLLVMVGAAAYAYRSRPAEIPRAAPTPTPEPAVLSSYALDPEAEEEQEISFLPPVHGEIVGEYRVDELIWSDTLKQWQTHPAVDIAAPMGTAVVASADGSVKDAYRDPLWGNVVVLEHADGYETVYAGLQTIQLAEVGADVEAGDIIGAVGNTADAEVALGAHLHFAMRLNGEAIEPTIDWKGAATE